MPKAREPEEQGDQTRTDESLVAELARLSPFEYDRKRKDTAKAIGITVATLDEQRGHANAKDADLPHWRVEPWPEAVSGDRLLNDLATVFSRYVILPKHAADALALWVVHAWAFDAWDISPFMVLVSPEKRCGKTTVLIILPISDTAFRARQQYQRGGSLPVHRGRAPDVADRRGGYVHQRQ